MIEQISDKLERALRQTLAPGEQVKQAAAARLVKRRAKRCNKLAIVLRFSNWPYHK
jgi:hypothetical protein